MNRRPYSRPIPPHYMVGPSAVHDTISGRILADGYPVVVDLAESLGSRMVDRITGRSYLDFFSCFCSLPLGWNHPALCELEGELGRLSVNKITNSDLYTTEYADAVESIASDAMPSHLDRMFFIAGGAMGVENTMKAAMDWKFQKLNGAGPVDSNCQRADAQDGFCWNVDLELSSKISIGHFREAFHGRSGYTLSVTNTDPAKSERFTKHKWPRFSNPKINFPIDENEKQRLIEAESKTLEQIRAHAEESDDSMAAVIIEPIQGEGGDNHFTDRFLNDLQSLTHEIDALFIVDEVQTGVGATGRMWAFEHSDIRPDLVAFGKKMQVCGMFAGGRLHEVEENVLTTSSRINSTWGGDLSDMVRGAEILRTIHRDDLLQNTARRGEELLQGLSEISNEYSFVSNIRGRGTMCAFTLPDTNLRDEYRQYALDEGLFTLTSGPNSIRLRPPLTMGADEVQEAIVGFEAAARKLNSRQVE